MSYSHKSITISAMSVGSTVIPKWLLQYPVRKWRGLFIPFSWVREVTSQWGCSILWQLLGYHRIKNLHSQALKPDMEALDLAEPRPISSALLPTPGLPPVCPLSTYPLPKNASSSPTTTQVFTIWNSGQPMNVRAQANPSALTQLILSYLQHQELVNVFHSMFVTLKPQQRADGKH